MIFSSILTVAFILHRCYSLGLRRSSSTGLPLLSSTKNLVVLMALPVAVAITTMVAFNGIGFLGPGSYGWVFYAASTILPFSNLSSSLLVGRFWRSRELGAAGVPDRDPAKTQPVRTLLIVFVGLSADVLFTSFSISSDQNNRPLMQTISIVLMLGYILTAGYFFFSGIKVLRSLSAANKPPKVMAIYLIMVAGFTLMIILSFLLIGSNMYLTSVEAFFTSSVLTYLGNFGATICHLFVFTANKDGDSTGDSGDTCGAGGEDETFLETANRELEETSRVQSEAIAGLEEEAARILERAELETRLHETEHMAELNTMLLAAEKKARLNAQAEKSSFLAAIHGE